MTIGRILPCETLGFKSFMKKYVNTYVFPKWMKLYEVREPITRKRVAYMLRPSGINDLWMETGVQFIGKEDSTSG